MSDRMEVACPDCGRVMFVIPGVAAPGVPELPEDSGIVHPGFPVEDVEEKLIAWNDKKRAADMDPNNCFGQSYDGRTGQCKKCPSGAECKKLCAHRRAMAATAASAAQA